jgi:hypothetical protein
MKPKSVSHTQGRNCQVYHGPLGVGNGQYGFFNAVAYKAGMTDSGIAYYEVDNRGL